MKKFLLLTICLVIILQLMACEFTSIGSLFAEFPFNTSDSEKDNRKKNNIVDSTRWKMERTPIMSALTQHSGAQENLIEVSEEKPKGFSRYMVITQTNGYDSLETGLQRKIYKEIVESSYRVNSKPDEQGYPIKQVAIYGEQMPEEEIKRVIYAFKLDNPLIFWISNLYGFYYENSNTYIQLYSVIDPNDCKEYIFNMNKKIDEIISSIPQGLSEFDRELYLHDYLLKNCVYDSTAVIQGGDWQVSTSYGAIVNGKAVCEGYAKAMQALLSYVNMRCTLVSGISGQTLHMWNVVKVDNSWYHLDVTWDNSDKMNRYDYFNVSDEIISKDHIIDPDYKSLSKEEICGINGVAAKQYNLNVPECNDSFANYFEVMAVKLDSLNHGSDIKINNRLYDLARNKKEYFSLKISDNLDYNNTIQKIFLKQPYKLLYYINEVNKKLDAYHQIDSSKIVYYESENQNAVTIKLSYS